MPKFLEQRLKAEYGADSDIPYKIMNSKGLMHGNKETEKGRALEVKHNKDVKAGKAKKSKPKASGLNWREKWGRRKVKG